MELRSTQVALLRCRHYDRQVIKENLDRMSRALSLHIPAGSRVLLKPNLVSGRGHRGLACSDPEFVAAVAEWCADQGGAVTVGDSPAFGRAPSVMRTCGITAALEGLPVRLVHFNSGRSVRLSGGERVTLAKEALDADLLINLPRVKAHSQTMVSLAVKNYFGTVKGFSKALLHQRLGKKEQRFSRMLVDLISHLPAGFTFIDGIEAMHKSGPMDGEPFPLGLVAAAKNPVALDTALLHVLGVKPEKSMVWQETARQDLVGANRHDLDFPFLVPEEVRAEGFLVPAQLKPIPFRPLKAFVSIIRRIRSLR